MPDGLRIERLERRHAEGVNALFNRVFQKKRALDHYLWKFWENPYGPPLGIVAVSERDNRIVASNAGIAKWAWVVGAPGGALEVCETAAEEGYRSGMSLYRNLLHALVWQAQEAGLLFAYGGQSTDTAIALGKRLFHYQELFDLSTYECRLSWVPALRSRLGPLGGGLGSLLDRTQRLDTSREQGFRLEPRHRFSEEFDALWERCRDRHAVSLARDSAVLRWRYAECPVGEHSCWLASRENRAEGYLVWRRWTRDGVVIGTVLDLFPGDDAALASALISRAMRDARERGCSFFHFAVRSDSVAAAALRDLGGFRISSREPLDHVIGTAMNPRTDEPHFFVQQRTMLDVANWHYTQGDSDFHD